MRTDDRVPCATFENVFANHEALLFRRGRIYPESFVTGSRHAGVTGG